MVTIPVWKMAGTESSFTPLQKDITVDVAIIGGGITGITAAYLLSRAGKKVAVLEALSVGGGTTGHSTGNLYAPIGGDGLHNILNKWGADYVKQVVVSRTAAINFIEDTVQSLNIDCDFQRVPWCLFTEEESNKKFVDQEKQAADLAALITSADAPSFIKNTAGFTVPNQAQFNPLQYTVELAQKIQSDNCQIFEKTKLTDITETDTGCVVTTTGGIVTARQVIMATHTPKGVYLVQTSLGPYREYAVAVTLKGNYPPPGIFWDRLGNQHYSLRTYDTPEGKVLLALGEAHKTGTKEWNEESFEKLENFLRSRFDVDTIVFKWAAQQYKPADGLPYIGLSSGNEKTYIATGFAADGLTYGTLAAMIITDQILGIANPWSETYKASRLTPVASFTKFVKENAQVAFTLVKDHLTGSEAKEFAEVQNNQGKIMEVGGNKCAVHRDENGSLHVVSAICPHMGCVVHWNNSEQTWDCPCHGSRFTIEGEVIEGPAIQALKKYDV